MPLPLPARVARRYLPASVLAVVLVGVVGLPAEAHALVRSSDPADGAILARAPHQLTISFTEIPDLKLSRVRLLNVTGQVISQNPISSLASEPATVQILDL